MTSATAIRDETTGPDRTPRALSVSRSSVANADAYESSVAGARIHSARAGSGAGENSVLAVEGDRFISTSCQIGFPTLTRATIPEGRLFLTLITSVGTGSRWCDVDLEPGAVLLYAPGVEHTASNKPGLGFTFVTATLDQLQATAEQLRSSIALPERGRVTPLRSATGASAVRGTFSALRAAADDGVPSEMLADEVLRAMTEAVSTETAAAPVGAAVRRQRRHAVTECISYVEAIRRVPSIAELCAVANLSERSLRRAFQSEFDLSPSKYFRLWALGEANRRLESEEAECETVTSVAFGLGFAHLGRFSGSYRRLFGELPSATLRS